MASAKYFEYADGRGNRWQTIIEPVADNVGGSEWGEWLFREGIYDGFSNLWTYFPARIERSFVAALERAERALRFRCGLDERI